MKTTNTNKTAQAFTRLILAAFVPALIAGMMFISCASPSDDDDPPASENPSGENPSGENPGEISGGYATVTGVSYLPEQAAFRIVFDKDIPTLSADDIEAVTRDNANLTWDKGELSGPDAEHAYLLPVTFKTNTKNAAAKVTVIKSGWGFIQYEAEVEVNLLETKVLTLTANPSFDTSQKVQKFTFTLEKYVPLTMEEVEVANAGTENTGITDISPAGREYGKYELGVTGKSILTNGIRIVNLKIRKNGVRQTGAAVTVKAYFELRLVSNITLSPALLNIRDDVPFPHNVTLTANVTATEDLLADPDLLEFALFDTVPDGLTLSPVEGTGAARTVILTIDAGARAGVIKVRAKAKEPGVIDAFWKKAESRITLTKNAVTVTTNAGFASTLNEMVDFIVIEGDVTSPQIMQEEQMQYPPHTIEVRDGGKLTVGAGQNYETSSLWLKGDIKVRSGGTLELNGKLLLQSGNVSFGDGDDAGIVFPEAVSMPQTEDNSGTYETTFRPTLGVPSYLPINLSFDGASKTLTVGAVPGKSGAGFPKTALSYHNNAGLRTTIHAGYSIIIEDNIGLDCAVNFGDDTRAIGGGDVGFSSWIQAEGGTAKLTGTPAGLEVTSLTTSGGYEPGSVLTVAESGIYCAAGREIKFSGNPLTLRTRQGPISTLTTTNYSRYIDFIPEGAGGSAAVKITAAGEPGGKVTVSRGISGVSGSKNVTVAIERTGAGGRLTIKAYPHLLVFQGEERGYPMEIDGYRLPIVDLGGTAGDWVGRIVLTKGYSVITSRPEWDSVYTTGLSIKNTTLKAGSVWQVPGPRDIVNESHEVDVIIDSVYNPF